MSHVHAPSSAPRHHTFHGGFLSHAPVATSPHEFSDLDIRELRFCHLQAPREIARVQHLRQEIQLPGTTLSDPEFAAREKKETSLVLSGLLSGADNSSEPSGWFRSASVWHRARASSSACRSCRQTFTPRAGK
ncbi:MAG: hypothetical protein AB7P37_16445 [Ramlibacter sp.]